MARRETTIVQPNKATPLPVTPPKYEDNLKGLEDMLAQSRQPDNEDELEAEYLDGTEEVQKNNQNDKNFFNDMLNNASTVDKKTNNVALERMVATIAASFVVIGTRKIFGVENGMVVEEAESVVFPVSRIVSRRTDKMLKVALPLNKLDKKDKADVEEIITVLGLYAFRLFMKFYQKLTTPKAEKEKKAEYINRLDAMNDARVTSNIPVQRVTANTLEDFRKNGNVEEVLMGLNANPAIMALGPDMGEM